MPIDKGVQRAIADKIVGDCIFILSAKMTLVPRALISKIRI